MSGTRIEQKEKEKEKERERTHGHGQQCGDYRRERGGWRWKRA